MAFVTAKQWVCNMGGHTEEATTTERPNGWLHLQYWQDGEIFELDICPRCSTRAKKFILQELARHTKPTPIEEIT